MDPKYNIFGGLGNSPVSKTELSPEERKKLLEPKVKKEEVEEKKVNLSLSIFDYGIGRNATRGDDGEVIPEKDVPKRKGLRVNARLSRTVVKDTRKVEE